jgi:hypothetical protein
MKTNDLVTLLATGIDGVEQDAMTRRYATAIGWGAFGSTLLMAILLGVRDDLGHAALQPMFWAKLGYVVSLAMASLFVLSRLSRPGSSMTGLASALAAPLILIWALAVIALIGTNTTERESLLFGTTWNSCPFLIATLSVPVFIAITWAMKGLAPTRLGLAGGAVGLASGAIGATVYSLHCREMGAPFLATWYLLGVLIPAVIGTLLGPRLLRW